MNMKVNVVLTEQFCSENRYQKCRNREIKCSTEKHQVTVALLKISLQIVLLVATVIPVVPNKYFKLPSPMTYPPDIPATDWKSSWPPPTYDPSCKHRCQGQCWSHIGIKMNKLAKMINGNRRLGYNLAMWNCRRGLIDFKNEASSKIVDVKNLIESKKLHMLCLVESDLHSEVSRHRRAQPLDIKDIQSKLHIPGYKIFLPNTWEKHGQARLMVYAKEELQVKVWPPCNSVNDLPTVTFLISLGREKQTVVNYFYREFTGGVSGLSDIAAQNERLARQIEHWRTICRGKRDFVSLGDANLCSVRWHDENYERQEQVAMVQSFLLDTACSQLVQGYTRSEIIQGGALSRSGIDHCYSNVPEKLSNPVVLVVGDSDHLGVVVTKYTRSAPIKPRTVIKRSYKNFNIELFLTDILNSTIDNDVTGSNDIEEAAEIFEQGFRSILDKHAPIKVFQMRKHYSPYVSELTKNLIKQRNYLKEEAIATGDKNAEKAFKKKGKEIKKALTVDKDNYFQKDFGEHIDPSTSWRAVKMILGQNNNLAPTVIKNKNEIGEIELVSNPKKLANLFNHYFREKIQLLREKTNQPPVVPPTERLRKWLVKRDEPPPPFQIKPINKTDFRKIMKKMKPKRVHGIDWIDSYSLKIASPLLEDSLIHLINLSIKDAKFSSRWKPQLIFPLHKKNERDCISNYRPVSHLVQVGKMVEYAVYFQIMEHFIRNNLFHQNHHGSLANHSTATATIQLVDMCLEAADNGELAGLCLLNQSAAYDLLCHQTLQEKLQLYNFSESSISWLMSYLGGRTQLVQVEARTSSQAECDDSGVPQGSVLGGLLHVVNSNDFPDCHEEGEAVVYVDDDSDFVKDKEPDKLNEKIQIEAQNSAQWLKDNRLVVAGEKSKLLIIGTSEMRATKQLRDNMKILVDGKEIIESSSEKLLGLVLNNRLTWKNHLYGDVNNQGLIPQLSKRLGMIMKISKYMKKEKLKNFAAGIFYSKLNYCLPVFGNIFGMDRYKEENRRFFSYTMKDNNNLQVLQNKLNRILLDAEYNTPTCDLLKQTGSLSIHQMIAYHTALTTYKIVQSGKPSYIAAKLKIRSRNTRQGRGMIVPPDYRLSIAREGFIYRGAQLMNILHDDLRNESNIHKFKRGVKDWVKENISVKPKTSFPSLYNPNTTVPRPPPPPRPLQNHPNTIHRYMVSTWTESSRTRPSATGTQQSRNTARVTNMRTLQYYFPVAGVAQLDEQNEDEAENVQD